jgi:hypothetical protein
MIIQPQSTHIVDSRTRVLAYRSPWEQREAADYARAAGYQVEYVATTGIKIHKPTIMEKQRAYWAAHPVARRVTLVCALAMIPYVGWAMIVYYACKWRREHLRNRPSAAHTTRQTRRQTTRPETHTARPHATIRPGLGAAPTRPSAYTHNGETLECEWAA